MKRELRLYTGLTTYNFHEDHITPVLTTLHWLPVRKSYVQDCGVGVQVS